MNGQTILVLGATGLIGSAVAVELAKSNDVHGVSRFSDPEAAERLRASGVRLIRFDVAKDDFNSLPDDYDYVFNEVLMNPSVCDKDPQGAFATHAFAAANMLARFRGCKGIVLGSTGSVYRPSEAGATEDAPLGGNTVPAMENYVLSKICQDEFAEYFSRLYNVSVSILRYYYPYDATRNNLIGGIAGRVTRSEPVSSSPCLYNPMFISDVAEMTIRAAEVCAIPPNVINVGGEATVSLKELASLTGKAIGKDPIFAPSSDSAAESWVCDSSKRIALLGREKVSLTEGIRRTIAENRQV